MTVSGTVGPAGLHQRASYESGCPRGSGESDKLRQKILGANYSRSPQLQGTCSSLRCDDWCLLLELVGRSTDVLPILPFSLVEGS